MGPEAPGQGRQEPGLLPGHHQEEHPREARLPEAGRPPELLLPDSPCLQDLLVPGKGSPTDILPQVTVQGGAEEKGSGPPWITALWP